MDKKKIPLTEQEKIVANDMTQKRLISNICKYIIQLNNKKASDPVKNGQENWIDTFPEKTSRCLTVT